MSCSYEPWIVAAKLGLHIGMGAVLMFCCSTAHAIKCQAFLQSAWVELAAVQDRGLQMGCIYGWLLLWMLTHFRRPEQGIVMGSRVEFLDMRCALGIDKTWTKLALWLCSASAGGHCSSSNLLWTVQLLCRYFAASLEIPWGGYTAVVAMVNCAAVYEALEVLSCGQPSQPLLRVIAKLLCKGLSHTLEPDAGVEPIINTNKSAESATAWVVFYIADHTRGTLAEMAVLCRLHVRLFLWCGVPGIAEDDAALPHVFHVVVCAALSVQVAVSHKIWNYSLF